MSNSGWLHDWLFRWYAFFTSLAHIRVFALVGPSGTGKSFRAKLVADRFHIRYILDDGILIKDQKIIAGRSAKREAAYLAAVKTALYVDETHRRDVTWALERQHPRQILLLGTSDRMILKICSHLGLPKPFRTLYIDEVANPEEIAMALESRRQFGRHVIPVPAREVGLTDPEIVDDSIKVWSRWGLFQSERIYEKTVVRPLFSARDPVKVSERDLRRAIRQTLSVHIPGVITRQIEITYNDGYEIQAMLIPPEGADFAIDVIQNKLRVYLEKQMGIFVRRFTIVPLQTDE